MMRKILGLTLLFGPIVALAVIAVVKNGPSGLLPFAVAGAVMLVTWAGLALLDGGDK